MQIIGYIDQVLPLVGEFGLFQFIYLLILCLLIIPCSFQAFITYFIAYEPPWQCRVNSTVCKVPGIVTTLSPDYKFRCEIGREEWEYTEGKYFSVVTQFDLSCERGHLSIISTSLFFIGMALGSIGIGFLGDRYGRAKIMKPCTVLAIVIALLSAFSPNYWLFAFSRFLLGCLAPGTVVMFFVVASEMVGPKHRPPAGIVLWMFFTCGLIILGLVAKATSTWKMLMIYSTAPYMILFVLLFFLPEPLRWLYVNNRLPETYNLINKIARINGKPQPEIYLTPPKPNTHTISPVLLFSSKEMFVKSMTTGFGWMVCALVYYGSTLASKDLTGQFHRDFILSSLVEFPAAIVAVLSSMYLGRKRTTQVPLLLGGVFIAVVACIHEKNSNQHLINTRLFFGLAGKFFLTLAYDVIYTWTVELYPTQIRSEAIGFVQITSRIGATMSPWIADALRGVSWRAPFLVMGSLSIVAALLLQFLPETIDQKTPEFLQSEVPVPEKPEKVLKVGRNVPSRSRTGQKLSLVQEEDVDVGEV